MYRRVSLLDALMQGDTHPATLAHFAGYAPDQGGPPPFGVHAKKPRRRSRVLQPPPWWAYHAQGPSRRQIS
jgi:hypothetical protein